jgi:hypothetical protein
MSVRVHVLSYAPEGEGETVSQIVCPICAREKLSITRGLDGIVYNCYRASCSARGFIPDSGVLQPHVVRTTRIGNPYLGEIVPLDVEQGACLGFSIDNFLTARPMWSLGTERIAFPILSPKGSRRGWVLRAYDGRTPKALTYLNSDELRLSHYQKGKDKIAVIVEDIPSAVKAAKYMSAVALLGTSMDEDAIAELQANYDDIIIALDKDATRQAIALQRRVALRFNRVDVVLLPMDLKDMEEKDLCQFLTALQ